MDKTQNAPEEEDCVCADSFAPKLSTRLKTLEIHCNCAGTIFIPDVFHFRRHAPVNTRKGAVADYAPNQLAV